MFNRLNVLSRTARKITLTVRKVNTASHYGYPYKYIFTKIYPSFPMYRETAPEIPWGAKEAVKAEWMHRFFWGWFFYHCWQYPEKIFLKPHHHHPNYAEWTDEELGIPPDSAGPYKDWVLARLEAGEEVENEHVKPGCGPLLLPDFFDTRK